MDGVKYAKYTEGLSGLGDPTILKDGHTMFPQDIVADLNRKSYLEAEICRLQNGIIKTYHAIHDWANNRESVGIYEISLSLKALLKGGKNG